MHSLNFQPLLSNAAVPKLDQIIKKKKILVPFYPKSLHKSRIVEVLDIGMLFNSSSKTLVLETYF